MKEEEKKLLIGIAVGFATVFVSFAIFVLLDFVFKHL